MNGYHLKNQQVNLWIGIKSYYLRNILGATFAQIHFSSMQKLFLFTLLTSILSTSAIAQDQQFTQFYASPLSLNPALTGAVEGSYRVGTSYRDQWRKVLENPIKTFSMFADLRFDARKKKNNDDAIGLGIMFFNDKVSVVDFSTTQISVSMAYHKALGFNNKQYLSVGLQGGLTQRNVSYGALYFHDQFDGNTGYSIPTSETLPGNNFSYTDYSAGLNYTAEIGRDGHFFAGAAIHHFLQPNISFYENSGSGDKLFAKYSAQFAANLPLTKDNRSQIHPRLLVAVQGNHLQINAGTNFRFAMGQYGSTALHLGAWARPVRNLDGFGLDAVVGLIGIERNDVLFGISYDLNIRAIQASQRQGALEISITYLGNYDSQDIICPKF